MTLKFGTPEPGLTYRPREGAYGLLIEDGKLAVVRVGFHAPFYYDLPGGGIDPGETPEQAVVREFAEETGLIVRAGERVAEASQLFFDSKSDPYDNLCHVLKVERIEHRPEAKVEADHELDWMTPLEALTRLRHEAHAHAVMMYLRAAG